MVQNQSDNILVVLVIRIQQSHINCTVEHVSILFIIIWPLGSAIWLTKRRTPETKRHGKTV